MIEGRWWRKLSEAILGSILPRSCACCGHPCRDLFCNACAPPVVSPVRWEISGVPVLAAGLYEEPIATAIRRLKYDGRTDLGRPLANLWRPILGELATYRDITLVPVPLHPARLAERGFNQAALLANSVARICRENNHFLPMRIDVRPVAVVRVADTPQQARSSQQERRKNVSQAFRVARPGQVRGRFVVVVDDVVTTGATGRACIHELRRSEAKVVAVLALGLRQGASSTSWPEEECF